MRLAELVSTMPCQANLTKRGFGINYVASVLVGQEEAPVKIRRRTLCCALGLTCCLHGCAGTFFDN
jgi:hypothetical protein